MCACYCQVILDDLRLLKVDYDHFSRTSDHFDYILRCAEDVIKKSLAYVDDTPKEQMQKEREQRVPSRNRENSMVNVLWVYQRAWCLANVSFSRGFFFQKKPFISVSLL